MSRHDAHSGGVHTAVMAVAAAMAAALAVMALPPPAAAQAQALAEERAGARLGALVQAGLREGGPWFTPAERAVIERRCGYAPGSWDGFEANYSDGVFHCTNGRRVDDPEMRAVMAAAEPRIEARVEAVMARPEVVAAIDAVARDAEARAMRALADASTRDLD